ncbi:MAG: serine/threonine protein kinase [Cyanobacteria bacterium SBLK]|nr:serine/threonine protein kinase [Cyanobacteria bacterium SBLK]
MTYCLNPQCPKPQNPNNYQFCSSCGSKLLLGDRYRALEPMVRGGGGRTFLGIDLHQSHCIIKQIAGKNGKESLANFRNEAQQLQTLGLHPNIPELIAYFETASHIHNFSPVLVQEFIEGQNIAKEIYDETTIQNLIEEVLPILQFIHDCHIVHRDINPQNFIRTPAGTLFLVDFSTAKVTAKTALAKTGTMVGSAAYVAPEQLRGKAVYASDLYSLGVICIHLLTGFHPFDLFDSHEGRWLWEDYLANPVKPVLSDVFKKMLADAVGDRYQSADEIYRDLHAGQTLIPTIIQSRSPSQTAFSSLKTLQPVWSCFRTLKGHTSSVCALAFHPNGKILASGGADRVIRFWDADTGTSQFKVLKGHSSIITAIVFQPQTNLIISCSWDYRICFWNYEEELAEIEAHAGWIKTLAITRSSQLLASGSADKTVKLWDVNTRKLKQTLWGCEGEIRSLVFNPKGNLLMGSGTDRVIRIWEIDRSRTRQILQGHTGAVNALVTSPSGRILFSSGEDRTIKIWDLQQGKLQRELQGHTDSIETLAMNSEGNLLVSGGSDRIVRIWHPGTGQLLHELADHEAGIEAIAIAPDNRTIATASRDKTIKLWKYQ